MRAARASSLGHGFAADGARPVPAEYGDRPEHAIEAERHQPAKHRRPQVVRQEMGAAQLLADAEDEAGADTGR